MPYQWTPGGILFDELPGSPIYGGTADKPTGQRIFLIDWDAIDLFLKELFPLPDTYGDYWDFKEPANLRWTGFTTTTEEYPLVAQSYQITPFEETHILSELDATEKRSYLHGAKVTVDYGAPFYQYGGTNDRKLWPSGPDLLYRHEMSFSGEMLKLGVTGWKWSLDAGPVKAEDAQLGKLIPSAEHTLTWFQVPSPQRAAITEAVGTVNSVTFLDVPPQSLLFVGADAKPGSRPTGGKQVWTITMKFLERNFWEANSALNGEEAPVGWNEIFRTDSEDYAPFWDTPYREGTGGEEITIYRSSDFRDLFKRDSTENTTPQADT